MADKKSDLEKRAKEVIERVKLSGLTSEYIRKRLNPVRSATNFSHFMRLQPRGVTEGLLKQISDFLDSHTEQMLAKQQPKKSRKSKN